MDGGLSLAMATLNWREILEISVRDVHPPLYYLVLHCWMAVVGNTALAAKYLSLGFSALTVAILYSLGRHHGWRRLGLLAAALLAISPVHIVNAAAIRDFVPAAFFATLSTYAFLMLVKAARKRPEALGRGWWVVFVLSTVAGLLTSYLNVGVLAAQMLYALSMAPSRQLWRRWLASCVAIAVMYAPWVWLALTSVIEKLTKQQAIRPPMTEMIGLDAFAFDALRHLTTNEFVDFDPWPMISLYLVVPAVGFVAGWLVHRKLDGGSGIQTFDHSWFLALALALLLALTYVIAQVWLRQGLPSRYMVVAAPFFVMLVAQGIDGVDQRRWLPATGLLAVFFGASVICLHSYHTRPPFPEWLLNPQGITTYLDTRAKSGDGVIFITLEQAGYYQSLSKRPLPWYYFLVGPSYLEGDLADRVERVLPPAVAQHDRLWLMLYQNGGPSSQQIVSWLNANAYTSGQDRLSDTLVLHYVTSRNEPPRQTLQANFADLIELKACSLDQGPGKSLRLLLVWQARTAIAEDYTVFAHAVDAQGNVQAQHDSRPQNGQQATSAWRANETFEDRRAIVLPDNVAPGQYWIDVGLYNAEKRLELATGDNSLRLGPIEVK